MTDIEPTIEYQLSSERRQKIAGFIQDALAPVRKTLKENEVTSEVIENFEAREYQTEAWNSIWQAREDGDTHGLIHLATGLGKTSVAVFDYAKFRQERIERGESSRALFVVHQKNILDQANERFSELLPETSRSFFSNQQNILPDTDITFASFQGLYNGSNKFPRDYFDYIIYDEAHHIEADTYKQVVEHFQPIFQLGLTATPVRMDEKDITEHFGKPLYSKTLPEAIAEGHLATVNYNIVFDDAVKEAIDKGFDPTSIAEIQRLFNVQPRNEEIARKIQETQQAIKDEQGFEQVKTIVFCADLEHANEIAELLDGTSYHSGKSKQQQDDIMNAFRSNGMETITVRDMFNEGVDIPDARLIIFLRSTSSETIFEQQLGRGLRKNKNKQEVTVLDFVANIERIAKIRELAESTETATPGGNHGTNGEEANNPICITNEDVHIKVHADKSEFIFNQEMINLLEKYNHLVNNKTPRINWTDWTNQQIVELALSFKSDSSLTYPEIDELSTEGRFPSSPTIKKRFGSVAKFIEACGFNQIDWDSVSDQNLIAQALAFSPDTPLSQRTIKELRKLSSETFPSATYMDQRYGSLLKFQELCGFSVKKGGLDTDRIVEIAQAISPDRPLNTRDINKLSKDKKIPSLPTIMKRFGSLSAFHEACGFEKINWSKLSNDGLITRALELSPDTPLTFSKLKELRSNGQFVSQDTLCKRFGSLRAFQTECGFRPAHMSWNDVSNEELIERANKLSPNKRLGVEAMEALGEGVFPSAATIYKRFGSMGAWHKARNL